MNNKENELLEKLSEKLGTTTEYLWGVLVNQAKIDAYGTIFQMLIIALFGYILYRLNKKFRIEKDNYTAYENSESLGFIMAISFGVFCVLSFIAFFHIGEVINALANPEYWALNKILKSII